MKMMSDCKNRSAEKRGERVDAHEVNQNMNKRIEKN